MPRPPRCGRSPKRARRRCRASPRLAEAWRQRAVDGFRAAYRRTMRGSPVYPANRIAGQGADRFLHARKGHLRGRLRSWRTGRPGLRSRSAASCGCWPRPRKPRRRAATPRASRGEREPRMPHRPSAEAEAIAAGATATRSPFSACTKLGRARMCAPSCPTREAVEVVDSASGSDRRPGRAHASRRVCSSQAQIAGGPPRAVPLPAARRRGAGTRRVRGPLSLPAGARRARRASARRRQPSRQLPEARRASARA